MLPTQFVVLGVQTQPPQSPVVSTQLEPLPHDVVAPYASPSALHTCVPVVPTQAALPGVQSHAWHTPLLHDRPAAQGDESQLSPSGAHVSTTSTRPATHRVAPAVQTRARQTPSRQASDVPHGTSLVP